LKLHYINTSTPRKLCGIIYDLDYCWFCISLV